MSQYELWLTDDRGRRLELLQDVAYLSFTRAVEQYGSLEFSVPFRPFASRFMPWFRPDWRVEVWRSPAHGYPLRREDVFLLRKPNVYTRSGDGMQMLRFYGRNGLDLLHRRHVVQRAGTQWARKSAPADDLMKAVVREQMLWGSALDEDGTADNSRAYPQNEFDVQTDASSGPSLTMSFEGKNVLEVLKDIRSATYQKNVEDENDLRVYFDVLPVNLAGNAPLGWLFVTRAGTYGTDLTANLPFSLENENIKAPSYSISHLDEINTVYAQGGGRGATQIIQRVDDAARQNSSRWNRCETVMSASNETTTTGLQDRGRSELNNNRPKTELPLVFLNTPGTAQSPRSLYGMDWNLGDRVRVQYADLEFQAEIKLVYLNVDEQGVEEVTGRNEVNSA